MKQNIIDVRKVINASGRMTKLGVSTPNEQVIEAMKYGASNYVVMDELLDVAGGMIASYIKAPAVCITASASSGIALTIASLIAKDNITYIEQLHHTKDQHKREILLLKGHNVNYGVPIETMVELGGGIVKEVGYANQSTALELETAISEETCALLYVKSHHTVQKDMVTLAEMIEIAKRYQLPVIVDAAAEEDLEGYLHAGADYVIYSGTKALEGPTSGFVSTTSIENAERIKMQYQGIGRAMKVGKEAIYGLVQAVKNYYEAPPTTHVTNKDLEAFIIQVNQINGLTGTFENDEAGRPIKRVAIEVEMKEYGKSAITLAKALEQGNPAIFTRNYYAGQGRLSIDPRPLLLGDLACIYARLQEEKA